MIRMVDGPISVMYRYIFLNQDIINNDQPFLKIRQDLDSMHSRCNTSPSPRSVPWIGVKMGLCWDTCLIVIQYHTMFDHTTP
jgi:hypothetical protein